MNTASKKFAPQRRLTAILILLCMATTGCVVHQGHKQYVKPATLGSELSDLQAALDMGVITEQEYFALKNRLTHSRDR